MPKLFVYGTLRDPAVQRGLFGREPDAWPAVLTGYRLAELVITDPTVIALSGSDRHRILQRAKDGRVEGFVLQLGAEDLAAADAYEVDDYVRVAVTLESKQTAYAYVVRENDVQYFEDIEVGAKRAFGRYDVTRDEVVEFAGRYDPQAFHLDDAAAAQTHFGRLSASGWHTCAMTMRMLVDNMLGQAQASLGAAGIDELRWKKPVYPGDTLRCETEVIEKTPSRSRPEMGSVRSRTIVYNQANEPVLSMISLGLVRTRPGDAAVATE